MGYCISLLAMFLTEPFFEFEYYFIPIFYTLFVMTSKQFNYNRGRENYEDF